MSENAHPGSADAASEQDRTRTGMRSLSRETLQDPPPALPVPEYPRTGTPNAIVHIGVGGFHRSHQAAYLDEVLRRWHGGWSICGVGLREEDRRIRDVLTAQDGLYTLLTVSPEGSTEARVIGSIFEFLFAPDDPRAVLDKLTDPATRIVSLTITEGGYELDELSREFRPAAAATRHDLEDPDGTPTSALGFLVRALAARRAAGTAPFTVMSCDNLPGNGEAARQAVTGFARLLDPALAEWIDREVAFPNSMVDRITPATTDAVRAEVAREYGIDDGWPVRAESFSQWVLEDVFPQGRPPWELVGVQLVEDVLPYEDMKLRMLNASHQAIGHLGLLEGAEFVHEVCGDPDSAAFLLAYMREEAIPTLAPVPGIDLDAYAHTLLERFRSTAIADTLRRLVVDASDRIPLFLLPVVRAQREQEGDIRRCALILAAWSIALQRDIAAGIPIADRRRDELAAALTEEADRPGAFLDLPLFAELGRDGRLRAAFADARAQILGVGARQAMSDLA